MDVERLAWNQMNLSLKISPQLIIIIIKQSNVKKITIWVIQLQLHQINLLIVVCFIFSHPHSQIKSGIHPPDEGYPFFVLRVWIQFVLISILRLMFVEIIVLGLHVSLSLSFWWWWLMTWSLIQTQYQSKKWFLMMMKMMMMIPVFLNLIDFTCSPLQVVMVVPRF